MIKPLVLIIDNDKSLSEILIKKIEAVGCVALHTSTAEEAKKLLLEEKLHPVLVFCNTQLPDLSGLEFFRQTLKRNLNLSVCMISNKAERTEILEALQLGVLDFISRPKKENLSSEKVGRLVELGRKKASVKNVLADKTDHLIAEKTVARLRAENNYKKAF